MAVVGWMVLVACSASAAADETGGASCTADAYRTWLTGKFLPEVRALGVPLDDAKVARATELAKGNPCPSGDEAYRVWLGVWTQLTRDLTARYDAEVGKLRTPAATRDRYAAALAASMPSPDTVSFLRALEAARPTRTGAAGYAAWIAVADPFIQDAFRPLNNTTSIIFEDAGFVNPVEEKLFALHEAARPQTDAERGYAAWFAVYQPYLDRSRGAIDRKITAPGAAFLERLAALRPASKGDADYLVWFQAFRAHLDGAARPAEDVAEALARVRPDGGGERSYAAWLALLGARMQDGLRDGALGVDAKATLERVLAARPCSQGATNETTYAGFRDRTKSWPAEAVELVARAAPTTCP